MSEYYELPDKDIIYKKIDGWELPMHFYFPTDYVKQHKYPVVLCIHGGSFVGLTEKGKWRGNFMNPHAKHFSVKGCIGIAISYRSKQPEMSLDELIKDCHSAIRYLRKHAEELSIDPNKIAVMGDSAGGYLACCMGTINDYEDEEDRNVSCRANLVIACNPITDLLDSKWYTATSIDTIQNAKNLSPLYQKKDKSVPFLLIHGEKDTVVESFHSIKMHQNLNENGLSELVLLKNEIHAFILWNYKTPHEKVNEYMKIVEGYLKKYEYISN